MTDEELEKRLGGILAKKVVELRNVFTYLHDSIPKRREYACGFGWEEVDRVQRLERLDEEARTRWAMETAFKVVFGGEFGSRSDLSL